MADGFVQLPDDSANTGKKEDHYVIANGNYREAVVIGDPTTVAAVAPVSATLGLGVNILDGSNVVEGAVADAAVVGDNSGTISAKLRGINQILNDVWTSASHFLKVSIQNATLAVTQSGTWNITNISGTITLPTGASTAAKQPALGTAGTASADVITVQGIASMTKLLVTPDSVALPANQSVNVAQVGGTNIVTAGVNGTQAVGGNVATNVAIGTNPINLGAQAVSAENTAVTATRMAQLVTDLVGKLIVLPYANPENFVSGAITSAMTGTTSTSLIAAPASGLRNYITQITVSNAHATVGTDIIIQDGSGGTTLYTIPAAAVYGGATLTFPTPLRQPTTATAIYCANVTTGASTKVSASGYKGA